MAYVYHHFSSNDRDTSESTSSADFVIKLGAPLTPNSGSLKLHSAMIPSSVYNITSSNRTIDYDFDGAGAATANLTPGFYTATELASHMQTVLSAAVAPDNITVTYNGNTALFTWADALAAKTFQILAASGANMSGSNLWRILGTTSADGDSRADTSAATSITAASSPQIFQPDHWHLTIETDNDKNRMARFGGPVIRTCSMVLPRAAEFDAYDVYRGEDYPFEITASHPISTLRFKVTDETGTVVSFLNQPLYVTLMD